MKKLLKNKKGFTLIELLVVIAVIGILVLMAAPRFLGYTKDANVTALKADAKMLSNIAVVYNVENDDAWPTAGAEIEGEHVELEAAIDESAELYAFDNDKIKDQYKSLKNEITDYVIDITTGEVYHVDGVVDRAGNTWYNESLQVPVEVTP